MTTATAHARYPLTQGVNPWLVTVSVMLPTFMEVLDTAIASVALPYIAGSLSASNSEATWVLTSYLVANAVILPASNWFARRFGRKRFLLTCVILFTIASFFCGAAPSLAVILLARVMQGAGGGALQPLSQSILLESFPIEKRSMSMAAYGLGIVVAPVLGPTLGGWLTDTLSWRYAFYINIPVGILAVIMISRFVHDPPYIKNAKVGAFDNIGFGLLVVWTGCLQIVLDKGQEDDWFGALWVRWAVAALVVALLLWIWHSWTNPRRPGRSAHPQRPQLPHRLFHDRHAGHVHLHHHRHSAALLPGDSRLHGIHRRPGGGPARHRLLHRLAHGRLSRLAHRQPQAALRRLSRLCRLLVHLRHGQSCHRPLHAADSHHAHRFCAQLRFRPAGHDEHAPPFPARRWATPPASSTCCATSAGQLELRWPPPPSFAAPISTRPISAPTCRLRAPCCSRSPPLIAQYLGHRMGPASARPGSFGLIYGLMEQQAALLAYVDVFRWTAVLAV